MVKARAVGPKETFARYQLAAVLSIFQDFHRFQGARFFANFREFCEISWISVDFKGRGLTGGKGASCGP